MIIYSYTALIADTYGQEWYDAGDVLADDMEEAITIARADIMMRESNGQIYTIRFLNVEPVIPAEHDIIGGFIFEDAEDEI